MWLILQRCVDCPELCTLWTDNNQHAGIESMTCGRIACEGAAPAADGRSWISRSPQYVVRLEGFFIVKTDLSLTRNFLQALGI